MKNRAVQLNMFHSPAGQNFPGNSENPIHRYHKDTILKNTSPKGQKAAENDSFEAFLLREFKGEKVMENNSFSEQISEIMKENLRQI